jgi:hypothetical protein
VLRHHRVILPPAGENATVDFRVQGFDAAVHHLWKAGVVGHLGDLQSVLLKQAEGAAGRQQLDAAGTQPLGKFYDAGFV